MKQPRRDLFFQQSAPTASHSLRSFLEGYLRRVGPYKSHSRTILGFLCQKSTPRSRRQDLEQSLHVSVPLAMGSSILLTDLIATLLIVFLVVDDHLPIAGALGLLLDLVASFCRRTQLQKFLKSHRARSLAPEERYQQLLESEDAAVQR